jgi:hypothetical protein
METFEKFLLTSARSTTVHNGIIARAGRNDNFTKSPVVKMKKQATPRGRVGLSIKENDCVIARLIHKKTKASV